MWPQRLSSSISFHPDEIQVMRAAFDMVWTRIAPSVGGKASSISAARTKLADVVLLCAKDDFRGADDLAERVASLMFAEPSRK